MKKIIITIAIMNGIFAYAQPLPIDSNQIYMDSIYQAIGIDSIINHSTVKANIYPIRYNDGLDFYFEFNKNKFGILLEYAEKGDDNFTEVFIEEGLFFGLDQLNIEKKYDIYLHEYNENGDLIKQESPFEVHGDFSDEIQVSEILYTHFEYWTKNEKEKEMSEKILELRDLGIEEDVLISFTQHFFHKYNFTLDRDLSFENKINYLFESSKSDEPKSWCDCAYLTHNAAFAPGIYDTQTGVNTSFVEIKPYSNPKFHFTNEISEGPAHYKGLFMKGKNGGMAFETSTLGVNNPNYVMSPSYVKQSYNLICIGSPEQPTCECIKLIGIDQNYSARLTAHAPDKKFFWSDGSQAAVEEFAALLVANDQIGINVLDAGRARVRDACETTWNPEWFGNLFDLASDVLGLVIDLKTDSTTVDSLTSYQNNITQIGQSIINLASTPFANVEGTCQPVDKTVTLTSGKSLWALTSNTPTDIILVSYTYLGSRGYGSWETKAVSQSGYALATVIQSTNGFSNEIKDCCTDRVGHWNAAAPTNQPNHEDNYRRYASSYLGLWGPWNGIQYDVLGNPIFPSSNGGYFVYDDLNMDNCALTIPQKTDGNEFTNMTIDSLQNVSFNLYPNPTNDYLNIEFNKASNAIVDVSIFDVNGAKIETIYYGNTKGILSLLWKSKNHSLANGTYFVVVSDENGIKNSKQFIYKK